MDFQKKKGVPENLEAVKTKIYLKLEDILIDENANQSESPQVNVIENFNSLQAALEARIKKKQTFFNSSANQVRNEIRDWLDQYSNSNTENDVIQFWRHKSLSLKPIDREIAKLAQFYLTHPPTSVDVERLFSTAGDI